MPTYTRPNGLDYSYDRAALHAGDGIVAVARYLTGSGKALSAPEALAIHGAGKGIVLNYEQSAGNALGGARQGAIDGLAARAAVAALGVPAGLPIYYSVDFDATPGQMPTVLAYLHAADSGSHPSRCYGSYAVVEAFGRPGWQTYAWSYGRLSAHAVFYQWRNSQRWGTAAVDFDQVLNADLLGAWMPHTTPAPAPTPPPPSEEDDMYQLFAVTSGVNLGYQYAVRTGEKPIHLTPAQKALWVRFGWFANPSAPHPILQAEIDQLTASVTT